MDWIEGKTFKQSSSKLDVCEMVINKWRSRSRAQRLTGLEGAPGSAPPVISKAIRNRVAHLACLKPKDGQNRYSQKQVAKNVGISSSMVSEILSANKLLPHKASYWCGKSPDPDFETKMLNFVGLYLNPSENALVLSVDEKIQVQALDRTQKDLPMRLGKPRRLTTTS